MINFNRQIRAVGSIDIEMVSYCSFLEISPDRSSIYYILFVLAKYINKKYKYTVQPLFYNSIAFLYSNFFYWTSVYLVYFFYILSSASQTQEYRLTLIPIR